MEKVERHLRRLSVGGLTVRSGLTWFRRSVKARSKRIVYVEVPMKKVYGKIREDSRGSIPVGGRVKSLKD